MGGSLRRAVENLARASDAAATRLADLDQADDLEVLGRVVAALVTDSADLLAGLSALGPEGEAWRGDLEVVCRHLLEARDLLDDGEPADAVAFEVIAARDTLRRALGH